MDIKKHKLTGPATDFVASPNHGAPFDDDYPDTIVIHYTAGGSAQGAIDTLTDPNSKTSAHVVVARDGAITQLVPFDTVAWHAGRSSYQGRDGFNRYALGIEIDNAGRLTQSGDQYVAWFGREYEENEVFHGVHRNQSQPGHWHRYSEEQIAAVTRLCQLFIEHYPVRLILGHEEIAPARKEDPGPAFPLDKLRGRLLKKDRAEDGPAEQDGDDAVMEHALVTAERLNIRKQPYGSAPLAAPPLTRGTMVDVLERRGEWRRVHAHYRGWVHSGYLKT